MDRRSQLAFLLLVGAQAAHSVEEYQARLFEVFAPARLASSLVSSDLALGFGVLNASFVAFGLWCHVGPVREGGPGARRWAWPWAVLEGLNGLGHLALAGAAGGYFPGALTAPLLVCGSLWLAFCLRQSHGLGSTRIPPGRGS